MTLSGCNKSWSLFSDFINQEASDEIQAFFSSRPPGVVRALVMRHAMGSHNTYAGIGSLVSEDAEINETGEAQATAVAEKLREAGVFHEIQLAVISPFTRALQTALRVIPQELLDGENEGSQKLPTLVHPLCAEQTFVHSHVGRGNRVSTVEELSRSPEFSLFDWKDVETYCEKHRVNAGKWWHHGPHPEETESSFQRRAVRLKKWLGSLQDTWGDLNLILVSHGGVMQAAFDYQPHPPNCAFRVYDLQRDGRCKHVARNEEVNPNHLLAEPRFAVCSVRRLPDKMNGSTVFGVEVDMEDGLFTLNLSENALREKLHDPVKAALSAELYERFGLAGLFPSWWSWLNRARADLSIYIQDYLEQLALAMGQEDFPWSVAELVHQVLLEGRVSELPDDMAEQAQEPLPEAPEAPASAGEEATQAEEAENAAECKVG